RPGGRAPGDERHHAAGREGEHRLVRRDVPHRIGGGRDRAERRYSLGLDPEAHPAERHLGNPARRPVAQAERGREEAPGRHGGPPTRSAASAASAPATPPGKATAAAAAPATTSAPAPRPRAAKAASPTAPATPAGHGSGSAYSRATPAPISRASPSGPTVASD